MISYKMNELYNFIDSAAQNSHYPIINTLRSLNNQELTETLEELESVDNFVNSALFLCEWQKISNNFKRLIEAEFLSREEEE